MINHAKIEARYPTIDKGYSQYGSDMGRVEWNLPPDDDNFEDKSIRVFHLPIDNQGYDVGGAYWGFGIPLYCATNGVDYRKFIRASNRADAIQKLGISRSKLKKV